MNVPNNVWLTGNQDRTAETYVLSASFRVAAIQAKRAHHFTWIEV